MTVVVSWKNVGPPNTPQEIKRLRRQVMELCRWHGEPIIWKHRWNTDDVDAGLAKKCPACFDTIYGQSRNDCKTCFSTGYVSVENHPTNYIDNRGKPVASDPGTGVRAPLYGGYGQGFLTWIVEPDVAVDVFKLDPSGVMVKTFNAQGCAPWFPEMGDNDLVVNVDLAPNKSDVISEQRRYELKMVNPQTIRGWGSRAQGQEHKVGQTFEMGAVPKGTIYYSVPIEFSYTDQATVKAISVPSGVDVKTP